MLRDKLPAHPFQMIDLFDDPSLRLRIVASATLMMLGTFASRLIFSRYANPNANWLLGVFRYQGFHT